eukprot:Tamp_07675.p1 GENE.Tamp_07675~~Tamp_07675.p1  ORF type:complete len:204 (+),score=35.42 Tamp_07675:1186-1797(+)
MHGVTCRVPVQTADESKRIHPGDLLLCVDGVDVTGKEAKAIETLIVGPYGSPIGLTLESGHDRERRSVRLSRKEHVTDRFILEPQKHGSASERGVVVPAPQEPTPARARRPDEPNLSPAASPNAQDAALVKVHELERKLQDLEKHMQKQADAEKESGSKLATQIASLQRSLDKKFQEQEKSISELKVKVDAQAEKNGCACTVS